MHTEGCQKIKRSLWSRCTRSPTAKSPIASAFTGQCKGI